VIDHKMPTPPDNRFHAHLDICKRCRERPFDLCPSGAALLAHEARSAADEFVRKEVR
jgi:hypothetical protein